MTRAAFSRPARYLVGVVAVALALSPTFASTANAQANSTLPDATPTPAAPPPIMAPAPAPAPAPATPAPATPPPATPPTAATASPPAPAGTSTGTEIEPTAAPPPPPAPAPTPSAPPATAPAAVSTGATATATVEAQAQPSATGPDAEATLDWDRAHRRYASWDGPTGGLYLFDGRAAEPGAIRVQLGLDGFWASDFLRKGDHVELSTQTLALSVTAAEWLELYANLVNRSAHQTKPLPERSLETLGDVSVGGRVGTPLSPLIDIGGDLRATLTNQTGGGGFEWGATSLMLRAALSIDLEKLERPVPLLFRFNLGYALDNTSVVVEDTENARYDNLSNARAKKDETDHLISRFERFALNINRMDRLIAGVGVELPLKVADKFYVHPVLEWRLGLPINRQGYDCPYIVGVDNVGESGSDQDSCFERDMSSLPMNLGFGVRVVPPVRGLSALLGVDLGLLGTTTFVRDLAPNTPWRVLFAMSYDYDARPQPYAAPSVLPVVTPVAAPPAAVPATGRVQGSVATPTNVAVANVRVRYVGRPLTDMITGEDGHFVTEPMPPGPVALEMVHPDYEVTQCTATIPPAGGDVPMLCTIKPIPVVGRIDGTVQEAAGLPVTSARIILSGPTNAILLSDAQGKFSIGELPPGTYQVRVEAPGYFIQQSTVEVPGRATVPVTLALRRKPITPTISYVGDTIDAPTITYATDSTIQPLATSTPAILEIADMLLSRPDLYLQILGFGPTNDVGLARAQALKQKLVDAGAQASHIEAVGGGINKLRLRLHR